MKRKRIIQKINQQFYTLKLFFFNKLKSKFHSTFFNMDIYVKFSYFLLSPLFIQIIHE